MYQQQPADFKESKSNKRVLVSSVINFFFIIGVYMVF